MDTSRDDSAPKTGSIPMALLRPISTYRTPWKYLGISQRHLKDLCRQKRIDFTKPHLPGLFVP